MSVSDLESVDEAIEAQFVTRHPGEEVVLYEGSLRVQSRAEPPRTLEGEGTVSLSWRPVPRIAFRVSSAASFGPETLHGGAVTVEASDGHLRAGGQSGGSSFGSAGPTITTGFLNDFIVRDAPVVRAQFHLVNLLDYRGGRLVKRSARGVFGPARMMLVGGGWRVKVDAVPGLGDYQGLAHALREDGSYAITHTGTIERADRSAFTHAEMREPLADLGYFLSFAGGRWSFPTLVTGFDALGEVVWRDWTFAKVSRWRASRTWWNEEVESLEAAFDGFVTRRAQPQWRSDLAVLVGWYVEASTGGGTVETGIILAQAALELLSSAILVEERNSFTPSQFDRLPAADKIRELINVLHVPPSIPGELAALTAEAVRLSRTDGPHTFTAIRNALIHAHKIDEVLAAEPRARYEAKMLGLWYVELAILWLIGFRGQYNSRFVDPRSGSTGRVVPW